MSRLFHSGDLGDIIYALPIARALGECEIWLDDRPGTKQLLGPRAEAIRPLLEAQPYVSKVVYGTPSGDFVDVATFRKGGIPFGERLTDVQSRWVKIPISLDPWITAPPAQHAAGRVIVHRSPRYHNPWFKWGDVADHYADRLLVVGSPDERLELSRVCGRKLDECSTHDMLELASLIQAADLFIGNQSSPCSVAVGLGKRLIQETCLWVPDCIYPERKDAVFCFDGHIPGITAEWVSEIEVDEMQTPPGGWSWEGGSNMSLRGATLRSGLSKRDVIAHTIGRVPGHFQKQSWEALFGRVSQVVVEKSRAVAY